MNSLFSGLMAIFIAFASICAGVGAPVSTEVSIGVDGDMSQMASSFAVLPLLKNFSLYASAAPTSGELTIKVDGEPAATVSVQQTEDGAGWSAASNLFPTTELTVKTETLQSQEAQDMLTSMIPLPIGSIREQLNPEAFQALLTPVMQVIGAFTQSAGEPEVGEFVLDGVTYSMKVPYNITYKEAMTLLINAGKQIVANESAAQLLAMFGRSIDPDSLDAALQALDASEETLPTLDIAQYVNEAGAFAFEGKLIQGSMAYELFFSYNGSDAKATLTVFGMKLVDLSLTMDKENGRYEVGALINNGAMQLSLNSLIQKTDTGYDTVTNLVIPTGAESALSFAVNVNISNNAPIYKAAEDAKALALEDMAGENSEAADAFGMELKQSIIDVAKKIVEKYPDLAPLFQNILAAEATVDE